jgi:hypothetical protein
MGELIPTGELDRNGKPKMRPSRLAKWRLTTGSRTAADQVATELGGTVKQWQRGQWEVYTDTDTLMVTIPPRDEAITQDYEWWNKGGCLRRCDGKFDRLNNKPCQCPADPLVRAQAAKHLPPQACALKTRINVMIPDLMGLGVWRLDTGSFYAAVELGDTAELMEEARARGVFLPAQLRIDQRQRVAGGKTTPYPVPVVEVLVNFRQIATGQIAQAGVAAQLPPTPASVAAIDAPKTRAPAIGAAEKPAAGTAGERPVRVSAQTLADRARAATTRAQVEDLVALANSEDLAEDGVCTDPQQDVWEPLATFLTFRWKSLPRPSENTAGEDVPPPEEPPADEDESSPETSQPGSPA